MQTDHREELAVGGKALFEMLALKPEWGKPAFRNFREGDGNGGIIRSPIRAIALPDSHNLDKNVGRESDGRVLPTKCPNKGGSSTPAESMEGRRPTKENTGQTAASQIQSWENGLAGLHRVREAAKREKRLRFTALLHHVSEALLSDSFYALKREAAPGVDGLTWQEYERDGTSDWRICTVACIGARIARYLPREPIFPSQTDDSGPWA